MRATVGPYRAVRPGTTVAAVPGPGLASESRRREAEVTEFDRPGACHRTRDRRTCRRCPAVPALPACHVCRSSARDRG
eukprot:763601-Hanusia_phi.AAC.3